MSSLPTLVNVIISAGAIFNILSTRAIHKNIKKKNRAKHIQSSSTNRRKKNSDDFSFFLLLFVLFSFMTCTRLTSSVFAGLAKWLIRHWNIVHRTCCRKMYLNCVKSTIRILIILLMKTKKKKLESLLLIRVVRFISLLICFLILSNSLYGL